MSLDDVLFFGGAKVCSEKLLNLTYWKTQEDFELLHAVEDPDDELLEINDGTGKDMSDKELDEVRLATIQRKSTDESLVDEGIHLQAWFR